MPPAWPGLQIKYPSWEVTPSRARAEGMSFPFFLGREGTTQILCCDDGSGQFKVYDKEGAMDGYSHTLSIKEQDIVRSASGRLTRLKHAVPFYTGVRCWQRFISQRMAGMLLLSTSKLVNQHSSINIWTSIGSIPC